MSGNRSKHIAFNYFGGKFTYVDHLVQYFPKHHHFIDVFCGSMAVTLNKSPSKIETANDINSEVINFFNVLRSKPNELLDLLELTPVSREEFNDCWHSDIRSTDLEKARRFYVRVRQSFFGLGIQKHNKGWQMSGKQSAAKGGEVVSKWRNALNKLPSIIKRLKDIQIDNRDWQEVITSLDFKEAFFYCDPPYPHQSRSGSHDYKFEFSDDDHRRLAEVLHGIKGMAMISSYDCPFYSDELYHDWEMIRLPNKGNHLKNTRVDECIWVNYSTKGMNKQLNLFS